jgi:hypothetical protein
MNERELQRKQMGVLAVAGLVSAALFIGNCTSERAWSEKVPSGIDH